MKAFLSGLALAALLTAGAIITFDIGRNWENESRPQVHVQADKAF